MYSDMNRPLRYIMWKKTFTTLCPVNCGKDMEKILQIVYSCTCIKVLGKIDKKLNKIMENINKTRR